MNKKRILITGASGNIGRKLGIALQNKYALVLLDRKKMKHAKIIYGDLREYNQDWAKYFERVSTVIHLAGNPYSNASWADLIPDNIDSVLNVCQACIEKKVKRLIFASSCHTMGGYKDKKVNLITTKMDPWPDCDYGISKLMGERICKSFSDRSSLSVLCLRIGWVLAGDRKPDIETDLWSKSLWLSNADLIQIFDKSIEANGIKFKILYAISNNKGMNWDLQPTIRTLNYKPKDGIDLEEGKL